MEFELTPAIKQAKFYMQYFLEQKGDIKEVFESIIFLRSNKFSEKDFKSLKIKANRLKDIFGELQMHFIIVAKDNQTKIEYLQYQIKLIKETMKKYDPIFNKQRIVDLQKLIDERKKKIKKLRSK